MEKKKFTVAIVGCGARGAESYGRLLFAMKEKYEIVALCDLSKATLEKYGEIFKVQADNRFDSEETFFQTRRADLVVIATPDKEHVRQCLSALKVGYDILMEKPVTDDEAECLALLDAQKRYGGRVFVCHVLRYAPAFVKVGELLKEGVVGRLVSIQALEQVAYWHQAHSYVRGNWRKAATSTPMILAKCCHDLDLLKFYANSACKSVSSVGDLTYFNKANAPKGAASRCVDCKEKAVCPYSATRIYVDRFVASGCPANEWPYNVLTPVIPLTKEALIKAVEEGVYGRCVFDCDNDVVDHQFTQMVFENGVKASLLMTAFTAEGGRIIKFYGTLGELVFDEVRGAIEIKRFGEEKETLDVRVLEEGGYAHGGGDLALITKLYDLLCGSESEGTSLADSLESHLMGICAEKSRKRGGELVYVHG